MLALIFFLRFYFSSNTSFSVILIILALEHPCLCHAFHKDHDIKPLPLFAVLMSPLPWSTFLALFSGRAYLSQYLLVTIWYMHTGGF